MESMLNKIDTSRPTIIGDFKRKIYAKTFASKWANLKLFLKERKSLESSVKLQKKKYNRPIFIQMPRNLQEKNRNSFNNKKKPTNVQIF